MTSNTVGSQETAIELKETTLAEIVGEDRSFNTIQSGAEMLLLYYINKELRQYGLFIDLEKFEYNPRLCYSTEVSYVASKGYSFLYDRFNTDILSFERVDNKFFEQSLDEVQFDMDATKENALVFDEDRCTENRVVHGSYSRTAYVALTAKAFVLFFLDGKRLEHLTFDSASTVINGESYHFVPILMYEGNRAFVWSITYIPLSSTPLDRKNLTIGIMWTAHNLYLEQLGYGIVQSTMKEKYEYIEENFPVGSVVWLYQKKLKKKKKRKEDLDMEEHNNNKNLSLFQIFPAIVRSITERSVSLEKIRNMNTRVGRLAEIEEYNAKQEEITEIEQDFFNTDYAHKIDTHIEEFPYPNLGVEVLSFTEEYFIQRPVDTEKVPVRLYVDNSRDMNVEMLTLDALYAMLEDWGIDYDKTRYRVEYMGKRKPEYEKYREFNGSDK